MNKEKLVSVAITRDDVVLDRGIRSHAQLRQAIDPSISNPSAGLHGDIDGFMTSTGRFVDRDEAKQVAIASGQVHERWKTVSRDLLSSDVDW
jgi:hypothetical protein